MLFGTISGSNLHGNRSQAGAATQIRQPESTAPSARIENAYCICINK